jgi:hypothetical protein
MILFCIFYLFQSKLYFVLTYVLVENFQTTSKILDSIFSPYFPL